MSKTQYEHRCAGRSKTGHDCQVSVPEAGGWCPKHDPALADERRAAAVERGRIGGMVSKRVPKEKFTISTRADVFRHMLEPIANELMNSKGGRITERANSIARLATTIMDLLAKDHDEQMENLLKLLQERHPEIKARFVEAKLLP